VRRLRLRGRARNLRRAPWMLLWGVSRYGWVLLMPESGWDGSPRFQAVSWLGAYAAHGATSAERAVDQLLLNRRVIRQMRESVKHLP